MSLPKELFKLLPNILPRDAENAITEVELMRLIRMKIKGNYSNATLKRHLHRLSLDPWSPLAKSNKDNSYYLNKRRDKGFNKEWQYHTDPPPPLEGSDIRKRETEHLAPDDGLTDLRKVPESVDINDISKRPPRFLQCKLKSESASNETIMFLPEVDYSATIRVGVKEIGWLSSSRNTSFPEDNLPQGISKHELRVAFCPLTVYDSQQRGNKPQQQGITLPHGSGNSTEAVFSFKIPSESPVFKARILVLHEERILQTALLNIDIENEETTFEPEAVLNQYFSDLENRIQFKHALLFNNNHDGQVGLTTASQGEIHVGLPEGIQQLVDQINTYISTMAYSPSDYSDTLEQNEALHKTLIAFARRGADLLQIINKESPSHIVFNNSSPVQILTKTQGAKIPIEILYDYPSPERNAKLCPGVIDNQNIGKCDLQHDSSIICPSGFWGLNRVIERHSYIPNQGEGDFILRNEPSETRRKLQVSSRALLAGSQKVTNAEMSCLKSSLNKLTNNNCNQANTWEQWKNHVNTLAPDLLALVVHTKVDPIPLDEQLMEIGNEQWLSYFSINQEHVARGQGPGPLLFLIGCETGAADINYQTLAQKFSRNGASVTVSSDATINTFHAIPTLERMIQLLHKQLDSQQQVSLGEIMRIMRCKMLSEGNPIIFCLNAYGDADWLLT